MIYRSCVFSQKCIKRSFGSLLFSVILILNFNAAFAVEQKDSGSDQQINDFSISGYGKEGGKTWDMSGKTADIYADTVSLVNIVGNLYGDTENVILTADKGTFNKKESKVHLEKNVVIQTSGGANLYTESLDWDRKDNLVTTQDPVKITKENMFANSIGARGALSLNKFDLKKDVRVEVLPEAANEHAQKGAGEQVVITCDGPLSVDYTRNIAVFHNNVKVDRPDSQAYSDIMEVYFQRDENKKVSIGSVGKTKIEKIIASGNVKIVKGENVSYSRSAVYSGQTGMITLEGRPQLEVYPEDAQNVSGKSGEESVFKSIMR